MGKASESSTPVYAQNALIRPPIPFEGKIRQLDSGDLMLLEGFVPPKTKGFHVNLEYLQEGGKVDILLSVGVRFNSKEVVRNTQRDGSWEFEEKSGGLGRLQLGKPFECVILVHRECFKIAFNGVHFANYEHRASFKSINRLSLGGAVEVDTITFQKVRLTQTGSEVKPSAAAMPLVTFPDGTEVKEKEGQSKGDGKSTLTEIKRLPCYGEATPYTCHLPGGLTMGRCLYLSCLPAKYAGVCVINLMTGASQGKRDIALHLKMDFSSKAVVLNTQLTGKWGVEQRDKLTFPFKRAVHFDLMFVCEEDGFKISVDNGHFDKYRHRIVKLDSIGWLQVEGDLRLIHSRLH